MKRLSASMTALVFAVGLLPVPAATSAVTASAANDVTVSGCLIKAADDDDALLVTALAPLDAPPSVADRTPADRRAPSFMRVVYWLDDDDDVLEGHQGRVVEIRGDVEGDIDRGEIKVEREDSRVEVEFKADGGRRLKARLPVMSAGTVGTAGGVDIAEREYDVVVRKLDVKEVRLIAPTCDGSLR